MAKSNTITETLQSCFPDEWVRKTARETGVVKRKGKVDFVAFFWTLLLGFGTGTHRTLTELRRAFKLSTGVSLVPSAFYYRFTPALCRFLKTAVAHVCQNLAEPVDKLHGKLGSFVDLVVADATVITLHDFLEKSFKACRTNHSKAALKLHMVISILAAGPRCVQVFSERLKEVKHFRVGPWVRGRLLLMDLGYYCFSLFERIDRNGGYFISRVKDNANFLIVATNREWRGRSINLVGQTLKEVLPHLHREVLDVMIELTVTRRSYRGKQAKVKKRFRLVGVRNQESGEYHLYLTNVPADRLSPEDVARVYAARWEVELLFKELKSHYRLDEIPSTRKHIVESLIYVAVLSLTVSRALLHAFRRRARVAASRTPERRWAATFQSIASQLLTLLLDPTARRCDWQNLTTFLQDEFLDPNVNRSRNLEVARA